MGSVHNVNIFSFVTAIGDKEYRGPLPKPLTGIVIVPFAILPVIVPVKKPLSVPKKPSVIAPDTTGEVKLTTVPFGSGNEMEETPGTSDNGRLVMIPTGRARLIPMTGTETVVVKFVTTDDEVVVVVAV